MIKNITFLNTYRRDLIRTVAVLPIAADLPHLTP